MKTPDKSALLDNAVWVLKQIIDDLPINRDWLDVNLEAYARNVLKEAQALNIPAKSSLLTKGKEPNVCAARAANGGVCPHHNLHCSWPHCEM